MKDTLQKAEKFLRRLESEGVFFELSHTKTPRTARKTISMSLNDHTFEVLTLDPRIYSVSSDLEIFLTVPEAKNATGELIEYVDFIKKYLSSDRSLGGAFSDTRLVSIETQIDDSTERKIGFANLKYKADWELIDDPI